MLMRTSITSPTSMYTDDYYNKAKYCGKTGYFNGRYKKGYQCVNYAVSRTCEIAKRAVCYYSGISTKADIDKPMFNRSGYGNAVTWLQDTLWEHGTEPKVGAIMVYGSSYGNGYGHVRVVEAINGNTITYSGANESNDMAFKTLTKPTISTTGFLGYIYNPYVDSDDLIKITKDSNYEYKWSVDGNKYGDTYDVTSQGGFDDTDLTKNGWERILKVNGSLFYPYDNKHYACGLEKSRGVNNQELEMSAVTDYNKCMAIACVDDELYYGTQEWIIKNKLDECYGAITGLGLILNGVARDGLHTGFESQWNTISGRTVIGEDKDGNILSYSFAGTTGSSGLTGKQVQAKCLELGFNNAIMLDGGGSVFRECNGSYDISTTRKVKNALILYRRKKGTEDSNPDDTTTDWEDAYNAIKAKYDELESEYSTLQKNYDVLKDDNTSLENEKVELNNLLSETKNELETAQNEREKLSTLLAKVKELVNE